MIVDILKTNSPYSACYSLTKDIRQLEEVTDAACELICKHTGADEYSNMLMKARWVLTELVTNVYKHGSETAAQLTLYIKEESLLFEVSDAGHVFKPSVLDDVTGEVPGEIKKVKLSDYGAFTVFMLAADNEVQFVAEEAHTALEVEELPEHYGMLIITNACSSFVYTYNKESDNCRFVATLPY